MTDARQKIWTVLYEHRIELTAQEIADLAAVENIQTVERYLSALKKADYLEHKNKRWRLVRDTGPLAVHVNSLGKYRDPNLNPPMKGSELKIIRERTGLSLNAFGVKVLGSTGYSTRLRDMENGTKPVGREVEKKAREFDQNSYDQMREHRDEQQETLDNLQEHSMNEFIKNHLFPKY